MPDQTVRQLGIALQRSTTGPFVGAASSGLVAVLTGDYR